MPPSEPTADPTLAAKTAITLLRPRAAAAGVDLRLHGGGVDRAVRCAAEPLRSLLLALAEGLLPGLGSGDAITFRITEPAKGRVRIAVDATGPRAAAAMAPAPPPPAVPGATLVAERTEAGGPRLVLELPGGPAARG